MPGCPVPGSLSAYAIWPRTTSRIVWTSNPCVLSEPNALSRLGPIVPVVPASASVWHEPHVVLKSFLPAAGSPDVTRSTAPQPAASAATSPATPTSSALRRGRELLVDGGDRLLAAAVDREDAVEAGDLEDLRDVTVAADQRQLTVVRPESLDAPDEDAERRRVDERRVAEVDDHVRRALGDHLEELLLELRRRVEVDLARQRDHVHVV